MPRIITTESNRATQINWYTQVPRKARRVDRKIRVVFVSGAGNTGKRGMLTASTQPANYVDLHKPVNNLNLYADSSALPRPVPSVGSVTPLPGKRGLYLTALCLVASGSLTHITAQTIYL